MTMTREEAVKVLRTQGMRRTERDMRQRFPAWRADEIMDICAEDMIDDLITLGILTIDQPSP
jgi:hypothetical protein